MTFQTVDDNSKRNDPRLRGIRHGKLSDKPLRDWLEAKNAAGAAVYVTVNETDGEGRRYENILAARASFIDLDGRPLPSKWPIAPHVLVSSSRGKYHAYWLLQSTTDLVLWTDTQARLAAFFKSDPKVIDAPRVLRLPGFWHLKGTPSLVKTVSTVDADAAFADRLELADLIAAHECDYQAPTQRAERGKPDAVPEGGYDKLADVARARAYIASLDPSNYEAFQDADLYVAACMLKDYALSFEKSLELLKELNERAADPWPYSKLVEKVKNSRRYGQNTAGAKSAPAAEDEFETETSEDWPPAENKQKVMRLERVTLDTMDDYFAFVNTGGKPAIAYWAPGAIDKKSRVVEFWSVPNFKQMLSNKTVDLKVQGTDGNGKPKTMITRRKIAELWLDSKKRRTYDGVDLVREQPSDHPESFNIWRGYGFEPRAGDWSLMRAHIKDVIANAKPERAGYITNWIAWGLQHPELPSEVALILKSKAHGTGKGALLRAVRRLYGSHGLQVARTDLLTGRFTGHLATACFVFVDEMTLANKQESMKLNSLLTEDVHIIEPKGITAFPVKNHLKVAAASNQDHVVLVSGSDRRFQIFEVSDKRARDSHYFDRLQKQMDAGGYEAMLHDLLELDLGEWHPRQMIADDKQTEQVASAAEDKWLAGYLESGFLDHQVLGRGGNVVEASAFYEHARRTNRALAGWTDYDFATYLKGWGVTLKRSNGAKRTFPPLADMRAAWMKKFPWWPPFSTHVTEWQTQGDDDDGTE